MHRCVIYFPANRQTVVLAAMLLIGALAAPLRADLDLPPVPEDGYFIQDYADALPDEEKARIGRIQEEAFEDHDTPIIIVTIGSMAEYGGDTYSIERFAHEWFNHWEIGKRGDDGELINRGILLLISLGDREARIELGADWGTRWDGHAARIMDHAIIPEFKLNEYGAGTLAASHGFLEMASMGPDASPPRGLGDLLASLEEQPLDTTPLPVWGIGAVILIGVGLIIASFYFPKHRRTLLISGVALIIGALVLWVLLAIIAFVLRSDDEGGFSGGGFSAGGGGFGGGGFSGGGGASGSW